MVRVVHILAVLSLTVMSTSLVGCGGRSEVRPASDEPLDYNLWDSLLTSYVDEQGFVDYEGFDADERFWRFIAQLNNARPKEMPSDDQRLAFWINAYNAFTIQLIIDNWPVRSITDISGGRPGVVLPIISSPWELIVANIEGKGISLQEIEDDRVIRLGDERVHFAINCASFSCPKLRREAYRPETLEEQLNDARDEFLSDSLRNKRIDNRILVSEIFSWYEEEFKESSGSLREYLTRHWPEKRVFDEQARVDFLPYNWKLNARGGTSVLE